MIHHLAKVKSFVFVLSYYTSEQNHYFKHVLQFHLLIQYFYFHFFHSFMSHHPNFSCQGIFSRSIPVAHCFLSAGGVRSRCGL